MKFIKKFFINSWVRYLVSVLLAGAFFTVSLILKDNYSFISITDSFGITFLFMFFVGCLAVVTSLGAFDTFGYGAYYIFSKKEKKYSSLPDYCQKKAEGRKTKSYTFGPYFIVSFVFLLVYIILRLL